MTTPLDRPKELRGRRAQLAVVAGCLAVVAAAAGVFRDRPALFVASVAGVVGSVSALVWWRALRRPRAVFFDRDLPASVLTSEESQRAMEIAACDERIPLAIARDDIGLLAQSPKFANLYRAIIERGNMVPARSPESLAALTGNDNGPDTYHIQLGGQP